MDISKTILSSLLSVGILFIIAKFLGHKQVAQLDFFDYINGITIGSIAAELATNLEDFHRPLISLIIYGIFALVLNYITCNFPKMRKYINGTPTILMDNGKIYRKNLKKSKLDLSEFMILCREQGYFYLDEIQTAVFEPNGKLSILPISEKKTLTPYDMNITPQKVHIGTEIIMDGRIMYENLKRMGRDKNWLIERLKEQGHKSENEILLGVYHAEDDKFLLYTID